MISCGFSLCLLASQLLMHNFLFSRIWESLGDAYMTRGSWHAALKSFQKVIQLSPTNIYATFQIGTVKLVGL